MCGWYVQSAKQQLATGQFPTISLKWPITISAWCIHFVHIANQIHPEKWPAISIFSFALCTCMWGMWRCVGVRGDV